MVEQTGGSDSVIYFLFFREKIEVPVIFLEDFIGSPCSGIYG